MIVIDLSGAQAFCLEKAPKIWYNERKAHTNERLVTPKQADKGQGFAINLDDNRQLQR